MPKDSFQTGLKKFLWLKKLYVNNDLNGEQIIGILYDKKPQKKNQQEFRIEKEIKKKGDKLYVKWKGSDSLFNNWINKKDLIT